MRLVREGRSHEGRAVDLADDPAARSLDGGTLLGAIRESEGERGAVTVRCPDPGPVHEHVGFVSRDYALDLRAALAAAARSRGLTAPQDDALRDARAELAALSPSDVETAEARRRLADAGDAEERLRERVAARRGRIEALRDADAPEEQIAEAETQLREATRRLSEAETERIAAEQRLDRARRAARAARDERARRLSLQDRIGNLERAARASLAAAIYEEFGRAVEALPGDGSPGGGPGEYAGDPITAGLGVARIAAVEAPIVLSIRRFPDATTAARRLDAPVVRL